MSGREELTVQADDKSFNLSIRDVILLEKLTEVRRRIEEELKKSKYENILSFIFKKRQVPIARKQ